MRRLVATLIVAALCAALSLAQPSKYKPLPPFEMPADIEVRKADIFSEGTRMSAEVFTAKVNAGKKLPTIIMAHGWGGVAASLRREAVEFAKAGYLVITFDYRGWGKSDSRVILTHPAPAEKSNYRFTAEVQELREIVDPLEMIVDWQNAIHWAVGEPQVDGERLGLWGSSLSGGLVVAVAARDHRIKALHAQVPALDGRWTMAENDEQAKIYVTTKDSRAQTYSEATRRARGELGYPTPGAKAVGNLIGAPVRFKFANYIPVEEIQWAPQCAMQFVIAEKEELLDNRVNGITAYERAKGPKNLVTIPGIDHYGIYYVLEARNQSNNLAIAWFDRYLKGADKR